MTWVPKTGAPASFSLAEAFYAEVVGDAVWQWLVAWMPLIGWQVFDTAAFCAEGPLDVDELSVDELLLGNRNPLAAAIDTARLAVKLTKIARNRIFGAYCESTATAPGWCVIFDRDITGDGTSHFANLAYPDPGDWVDTPTGATQLRVNWAGVAFDPANFFSTNLAYGDFTALTWSTGSPNDIVELPSGTRHVAAGGTWPPGSHRLLIEANCEAPIPWVPTPQPEPAGALDPPTRVYTDIADLGAELDRQELKLDMIFSLIRFLTSKTQLPPESISDPITALEDTPLDVFDAMGCIVSLTTIPSDASEDFGTPVRIHRVGRISLGTEDGWLTDLEIEHNPMAVIPFPPGVTRLQVNTSPYIPATVRFLYPPK